MLLTMTFSGAINSVRMTGMMTDDHQGLTDEACRIIATTVERVAREMIPAIAERVIREEIEKLKSETG